MQLDWIHLKSFLKHEDKRVEFTGDLNVMRAPNEAGKSSLTEGFSYFLSGSTALIKSVEDTVNYNAKSKASMKVLCGFTHAGKEYTGYRGASGAELKDSSGTVLVTGHKPVTEYLENLLHLPPGRAHHVMLANQNEIRGVLALGPTAATEFIEKLTDFSEIDLLIRRLVSELPNGKTDSIESQIELADKSLSEISLPKPINNEQEVATLQTMVEANKQEITALSTKLADNKAEIKAANTEQSSLIIKVSTAKQKVKDAKSLLTPLQGAELHLTTLQDQSSDLQEELDTCVAHKVFTEVGAYQGAMATQDVWEGDLDSLEAEIISESVRRQQHLDEVSAHDASIRTLNGKRIGDTTCPTCGHDSGDPEAAATHNKKLDKEIDIVTEVRSKRVDSATSIQEDINVLTGVVKMFRTMQEKASAWPEHFICVDESTVPFTITFDGKKPEKPTRSQTEIRKALYEVQTEIQSLESMDNIEVAEARLHDAEGALASLQAQLTAVVIPESEVESLSVAISELESQVTTWAEEITKLVVAQSTNEENIETLKKEQARWSALLDKSTTALKEVRENNVFIKSVKTARLKVSEQIWATVMGGVSGYFSQLRGVPSVVTRTPKGFAVDGKPGRPSGSTLDILGLALRIVVAKVFANSGLLIVDEPSAGCDAERTANMAAVIKSAGFDQVIWVSHDDISEACAANLIEL